MTDRFGDFHARENVMDHLREACAHLNSVKCSSYIYIYFYYYYRGLLCYGVACVYLNCLRARARVAHIFRGKF